MNARFPLAVLVIMIVFAVPSTTPVQNPLVADACADLLPPPVEELERILTANGYDVTIRADGKLEVNGEVGGGLISDINTYYTLNWPGVTLIWVVGGGKTIITVLFG